MILILVSIFLGSIIIFSIVNVFYDFMEDEID